MTRGLVFSDVPKLFRVLRREGYEPLRVVGSDKLICTKRKKEWFIKACSAEEERVYSEVLPFIEGRGLRFRTLVLPRAQEVLPLERKRKLLVLPLYRGKTFHSYWNEWKSSSRGGRGVDLDFSSEAISVLADLSQVRLNTLRKFDLPRFDVRLWRTQNLPAMLGELRRAKLLQDSDCEFLSGLLDSPGLMRGSKVIFSNGDFYPRNFIRLPRGRVTLLDWEARTDRKRGSSLKSMRNALIAPIELHLAFLYLHMWGNPLFQQALRSKASKSLRISSKRLDHAIVVRGLEQAYFWREEQTYLPGQMIDIALNTARTLRRE